MSREGLTLSVQLLSQVLAGNTYASTAPAHDLSRTAVERRVKSLVLQLVRQGLVPGMRECEVNYLHKIRSHRATIEGALHCCGPTVQSNGERVFATRVDEGPSDFSPEAMALALRRLRRRSPAPERDVAMVMIVLATGLRPLEIARLNVGDYLSEDGTVKTASTLRAEVTNNAQCRPLFFKSGPAREAIDAYLSTRLAGGSEASRGGPQEGPGSGSSSAVPYRGLHPDEALFLDVGHRRFEVQEVRTSVGRRWSCEAIHYNYRKIFRWMQLPGVSALDLRRTVVERLRRSGAEDAQIGELLGVRRRALGVRPRRQLDELMGE